MEQKHCILRWDYQLLALLFGIFQFILAQRKWGCQQRTTLLSYRRRKAWNTLMWRRREGSAKHHRKNIRNAGGLSTTVRCRRHFLTDQTPLPPLSKEQAVKTEQLKKGRCHITGLWIRGQSLTAMQMSSSLSLKWPFVFTICDHLLWNYPMTHCSTPEWGKTEVQVGREGILSGSKTVIYVNCSVIWIY